MDDPRTLGRRYRLEAPVGRGGMGVVHRARDLQLERDVAIKLVSEAGDASAKERFLTEARRTAGLRHPSIVEVFDVGEDEGDAFLVMELLEGETVHERLRRSGHIEPAEVVAIAREVCDALTAAHEAGIVHRDLKPANVFLQRGAEEGRRVKLLDFGIAKRIDGATARTDPNSIVGTFEYMAPEQIRGGRIDGRTDLYALGMTLYRMLTATPAFEGENVAALIHQQLDTVPMSLRVRAPSHAIPAWLDAVVLRLLAKEMSARYASARDLKLALAGETDVTSHVAHGAPPAASPREGMRMLEDADGDSAASPPLELDLPDVPAVPAQPVARVPQPMAAMPAAPLLPPPAPIPAWMEPLANVPVALSKRVLGYSVFAFMLNVVFFHGGFVVSVTILALAAVGGACLWAASRVSP